MVHSIKNKLLKEQKLLYKKANHSGILAGFYLFQLTILLQSKLFATSLCTFNAQLRGTSKYLSFVNCSEGLKREYAEEYIQREPRVPYENVGDRVNTTRLTLSQPGYHTESLNWHRERLFLPLLS